MRLKRIWFSGHFGLTLVYYFGHFGLVSDRNFYGEFGLRLGKQCTFSLKMGKGLANPAA